MIPFYKKRYKLDFHKNYKNGIFKFKFGILLQYCVYGHDTNVGQMQYFILIYMQIDDRIILTTDKRNTINLYL